MTHPGSSTMDIVFIHPDLGIGGAERLVVDAALGMKKRGHRVRIVTSFWDRRRSFKETRDGSLDVTVLGNLLPRHLFGRFHTLMAILRQLHLAAHLLASMALDRLRKRRGLPSLFVVDQLSACLPLLRWLGQTRVLFYCHFPDQLLANSKAFGDDHSHKGSSAARLLGLLKRVYRAPLDGIEEYTTGMADSIVVNSNFTAKVVYKTFPGLHGRVRLGILHPGVDPVLPERARVPDLGPFFLSINRFEGKKNLELALQAFARLEDKRVRLVLAGGFDKRLAEMQRTLKRLLQLAASHQIEVLVWDDDARTPPPESAKVIFWLNPSTEILTGLLTSEEIIALLYTPSNEHFGIVPLEGMRAGVPVVATNTGGPLETVLDARAFLQAADVGQDGFDGTGLLVLPVVEEWTDALRLLQGCTPAQRASLSKNAQRRLADHFSLDRFSGGFQAECTRLVKMGPVGIEPRMVHAILAVFLHFAAVLVMWILTQGVSYEEEYPAANKGRFPIFPDPKGFYSQYGAQLARRRVFAPWVGQ